MKKSSLVILGLLVQFAMQAATPSQIIKEVKQAVAPDGRQVVFEVEMKGNVLRGVTSEPRAREALVTRLKGEGVRFTDSLGVYPQDQWAIVRIPVASMRTRGAHAGEMATQAIMGMPVRLFEKKGEWWRAQTPDGYIAWVPESSVQPKTAAEMSAWRRNADRRVVNELWQTRAFTSPTATGPRDVVTDLVLGAIVEAVPSSEQNGRTEIILPDGRRGWTATSSLTPIAEWADQPFDAQKILDTAYSLEGSPYLWGGTSNKSVDCSGLAKVSYLNNGIILRRDASQQALTGTRLDAGAWRTYRPGDLLFFGNAKTGKVTHVAIFDSDGRYVHSSGRVKRNSLDPESPDYLYSPLHSVRIHGNEGTDGITRAIAHPWLFE